MQTRHIPRIDLRYWFGITFASIFGTNLGDFYAHESGLGLGFGLLLLIGVFAITYLIEARDAAAHEVYYWLAIIIIRTGATNIADYLAFRVRIPGLLLVVGLAAIIAFLGWQSSAPFARTKLGSDAPALVKTKLTYWGAMLGAGVFGTVLGDICSHQWGQGRASIGLAILLVSLLAATKNWIAISLVAYWCVVALARTAGTCIGDWLAENRTLHFGLPLSTMLTGAAFVAILTFWRSTQMNARVTV